MNNVDSPVKHRSILSRNRPYKNRYHVSTSSVQDRDLFLTHKADPDDLLVFGYESKLFPPDGNSAKIRKHLHLIPWNDDHNLDLLIDRYDCRGSLHDLSEFDSDSWNITHKLSEEESRLEDALDLERYKDLHAREEMDDHQDEELKRLRASITDSSTTYNEVSLQYNEIPPPPSTDPDEYDPCEPTNDEEDEDEKPFIAPHSLAIPPEMEIPATEKMNAVIEKTAKFISQQGLQMEIVLKAKQANNSQFQFLQFEHYLNPYYKHMVKRISEGKYNPGQAAPSQEEEPEEEESESDSDDDGNYLHPSLFASSQKTTESKENEEKMKVIKTAVDLNHPLAKLIEQGKKASAMRKYEEMARMAQHNNNGASPITAPPMPSYTPTSSCDDTSSSSVQPQLPEDHHILPPPPDLQLFVEEIARRAAVEGTSIESSLLSSDSTTYCFLQPWHELHPYYSYRKIAWMHAVCPPPPPANETDSDAEKQDEKEEEEVEKTGPISFCIKTKISTKPKPLLVTKLLEEAEVEDEEEELLAAAASGEQSGKQEDNGGTATNAVEDCITPVVATLSHTHTPTNGDDQLDGDGVNGNLSTIDKTKLAYMQHYESTSTLPPQQHVTSQSQHVMSEAAARPSLFTAVTPSGESASIDDIRRKQAERRQRAVMFMKKREQIQQQEETVVDGDKDDDVIKVPVMTSATNEEDIFDLSEPRKEVVVAKKPRVDVDDVATELLASQLLLTKKLDIGESPVDEISSEEEEKPSKSKKHHHRKRKRSSSSSERGGGKSKSKKSSKREKKSKKSSRHATKSHKHKKRKFKESAVDSDEESKNSRSTHESSKKSKKSKKEKLQNNDDDDDLSEGELRSD